ncbi:MAG: 50S ribosomal protein L24e [Candidatus Nitrosocaldus sp.]|nr:50S ribosomal protein L24e [Candidatus Nitrosocaldus sp.]MCS7141754.1 50S ribosomal protein L24e [Candidatus Nitrosocaldus sp.]MDW8000834.1 50S ribosomal protein L24e [Candidatus Nitrosocaldus sp.]MDW8276320.1 50S ribosomal protein L24e [Candidatus Nitrosocaldus sp.]
MSVSGISTKSCSFCGEAIRLGDGRVLVRNDGSMLYFCSSKCWKNMLVLRRDARMLKWTKRHVKGGIKVGRTV